MTLVRHFSSGKTSGFVRDNEEQLAVNDNVQQSAIVCLELR